MNQCFCVKGLIGLRHALGTGGENSDWAEFARGADKKTVDHTSLKEEATHA